MKRMKLTALVLIFASALAIGWTVFKQSHPSGSWRYRMTVYVETPEGIKVGSVVREVKATTDPKIFFDQSAGRAQVIGEAVAVDLGSRGILFALLRGPRYGPDYGHMIVLDAFKHMDGGLSPDGIRYFSNKKDGKVSLEPGQYPMFIRFRDITNPGTAEEVLKMEAYGIPDASSSYGNKYRIIADRFEELFGPGVKLKEVTIEMTDEPVTTGIEKIIPTFDSKPHYVSKSDFKKG